MPTNGKHRIGSLLEQGLVGASILSIGIRLIGAAFGFAFNVMLSRTLGVRETGIVMFYLNFATLIGLVATGGMDVVGLRELSRYGGDPARAVMLFGRLLSNALLSALLFSFGGFVFLALFGRILIGFGNIPIYTICASMLFLGAFQKTLSDWLIALGEFASSQFVFYFINRVVSVGLVVFAFGLFRKAGATAGFYLFAYAAGLSLTVLYAVRRLFSHFPRGEIFVRFTPAIPLFREGIACATQNAAFIALSLSPFVLLGAFSSASEVGLFGVSQRLVALIVLALTTISQFAMKDFAQAFGKKDFAGLAETLTSSIRMTSMASVGLTFPLVAFAPVLVLVFGRGFESAAPVLVLLSIGICAQCLGMPFQAALFGTNNEIAARNVTVACAVIGIGLEAMLASHWGARGVAFGMGAGLLLQSAGHGLCMLRALPVNLDPVALRVVPRGAA